MHAPVAKQNTSTSTKNTLTNTALTHTRKKKKNAHFSSSMHAPGAYVRVCLRLSLLLTPAPVSGGSVCGGGGVCLWLAFLFRFVGAFVECVCVNVSDIYLLGEGIKVSGGGGSVCVCVCVRGGGGDGVCVRACVRARVCVGAGGAFVCVRAFACYYYW
mgnify:CR=1 FL=1